MLNRMNEDVAWERMKDIQREVENGRLANGQPSPWLRWMAGVPGQAARFVTGRLARAEAQAAAALEVDEAEEETSAA